MMDNGGNFTALHMYVSSLRYNRSRLGGLLIHPVECGKERDQIDMNMTANQAAYIHNGAMS